MTRRTRHFVIASLSVLTVGIGTGLIAYYVGLPSRGLTGQTVSDDLRYVPSDAALVAFVDVEEVTASELRARVRRRSPPQSDRPDQFTNRMGIDVERDVDRFMAYLAPAAQGGERPSYAGVILARGTFDETNIEAVMREHGARVEEHKGIRLIVAGQPRSAADLPGFPDSGDTMRVDRGLADVSLAFVEPGLAAFGSTELVRRAIDMKDGGSENVAANAQMMNLVQTVDSGTVWAAGRLDPLGAGMRLPPLVTRYAQHLTAVNAFALSAHINSGVDAAVRAETRDEQSATGLREALQGLLALGKLTGGSQPGLKLLIDSFQMSGTGTTVSMSFRIPPELFDGLDVAAPIPPAFR
jgi:hypothetical protein